MASVTGIREKVHLPIYDSIFVEPAEQLRKVEAGSTLKFFVNVQGKTKLETNLQSASLLPHYNTFEARAMRVVISDLPPEFSDEVDIEIDVVDISATGTETPYILDTDLKRAMELLEEARESDSSDTTISVIVTDPNATPNRVEEADENTTLDLTVALEDIDLQGLNVNVDDIRSLQMITSSDVKA